MPELDIWIYWVVIGIILIIVEMFTPGFVLGLIGVSAILSGVAAYIGFGSYVQTIVFIISNFILFIFVRKIIYSYFNSSNSDIKTNVEALSGKKAIVTKKISIEEPGEVKIGGELWYAAPVDNSVIEKDTWVEVVKIEGSKAIVKNIIGGK
ncbi:MAG: NfeD family protein [Candidatus Muirbacterium halophilum]|nr:NfeD family protein [Candidatus Muirbacterium halophilum]MCK9474653.1 NfeD family protein [Candidatus Muirbacterium halophilum]